LHPSPSRLSPRPPPGVLPTGLSLPLHSLSRPGKPASHASARPDFGGSPQRLRVRRVFPRHSSFMPQ
jgi:hypothetical protein